MLVFDVNQRLEAVLTRLSDQHGDIAGHWFVEAGFGPLDRLDPPTFASLDAAQDWISERLARRPEWPQPRRKL